MDLQPKADVGLQTSSVAAYAAPQARGLQSLVPSDPYLSKQEQKQQQQLEPLDPPAAFNGATPSAPVYGAAEQTLEQQVRALDAQLNRQSPMAPNASPMAPNMSPMGGAEPKLSPMAGGDAGLYEKSEAAQERAAMDDEPEADEMPAPTQVAMLPRSDPRPAMPPMTPAPGFYPPEQNMMPASEVSCRQQLKRIGVVYRDMKPINQGNQCRVDYPVQVIQLSGGIFMKPAATVTCQMALAFASWTRNELAPAARTRYLSGIKTIHQGSSYSCRNIAGTRTASEHSKGNALDIMRIELNGGQDIEIEKKGSFSFRERGLLNTVRTGGCRYFNTVLGPGYNADHADHFHFDIKQRRNGRVACR